MSRKRGFMDVFFTRLKVVAILFVALLLISLPVPWNSIGRAFSLHTWFGLPFVTDPYASIAALILAFVPCTLVGWWLKKFNWGVAVLVAVALYLPALIWIEVFLGTWSLFSLLIILLPLWGLHALLSSSGRYRGWFAEQQVAWKLHRIARRVNGIVLNDIILQDDKHSTEIDHLLFTRKGVFVIETKSARWVRVSEDGRWFRGTKEDAVHEMHSPVAQNRGHVTALQHVLGTNLNYIPLVVFTRATFKGLVPANVVRLSGLAKAVASVAAEKPMSDTQIEAAAQALRQKAAFGSQARSEHVRRTQAKHG